MYDVQVNQIEKLFVSSSHKKVWDHFTKAQRKNIEMWKKSAMEAKNVHADSFQTSTDEMEMSDSDCEEISSNKRMKLDASETNSLKDENDSLRCQLEAYKNELSVLKTEMLSEMNSKNERICLLQEALQAPKNELEITNDDTAEVALKACGEALEPDTTVATAVMSKPNSLAEKEAKLIGLISIFLNVHPFGAGVEYIFSFLQKIVPNSKITDIEQIMSKFPAVFEQKVIGIGANMERRWKYAGFVSVKSENSMP